MQGMVSVIIPNYNSEKYIGETIESVLSQTYSNWELIIVDDCSTDASVTVIENYIKQDDRIRLFRNEKNRGAAYTRNVGLQQAQGKWVAFLDSDDLWTPEKLEKQVAFMKENGYAFSYTDYTRVDENSQSRKELIVGPNVVGKRKLFRYNYLGCLTVMYDREYMGLLQVKEEIANGRNDYALWLKAVRKAKCYRLAQPLAKYRVREASLSHGSLKKLFKYQYQLFRVSEEMNPIRATYHVCINLLFGATKKLFHKKRTSLE